MEEEQTEGQEEQGINDAIKNLGGRPKEYDTKIRKFIYVRKSEVKAQGGWDGLLTKVYEFIKSLKPKD